MSSQYSLALYWYNKNLMKKQCIPFIKTAVPWRISKLLLIKIISLLFDVQERWKRKAAKIQDFWIKYSCFHFAYSRSSCEGMRFKRRKNWSYKNTKIVFILECLSQRNKSEKTTIDTLLLRHAKKLRTENDLYYIFQLLSI